MAYVEIDGWKIDATPTEGYAFNSQVTTHPIEDGSLIADHVRLLPNTINLLCIVSNDPIGEIANARPVGSIPGADTYDILQGIRSAKRPVTVKTSLATFENMIIVGLSVPRDASNTNGLEFNVSFQQIDIITNIRTSIKVTVPRAKRKVVKGHKPSAKTGSLAGITGTSSKVTEPPASFATRLKDRFF